MHNEYHLGGMHFFWWTFWIIILVWIATTRYNFINQQSKKETALDILKKRFAKGEITKAEFEEKKKDLEKS